LIRNQAVFTAAIASCKIIAGMRLADLTEFKMPLPNYKLSIAFLPRVTSRTEHTDGIDMGCNA